MSCADARAVEPDPNPSRITPLLAVGESLPSIDAVRRAEDLRRRAVIDRRAEDWDDRAVLRCQRATLLHVSTEVTRPGVGMVATPAFRHLEGTI
jgi:hypothetical protein